MKANRALVWLSGLGLAFLSGCGGGSSTASNDGSLNLQAVWHPAPGAVAGRLPRSSGSGNPIPDDVGTARVIFDSPALHCCLAFDPLGSAFSQPRLLVLDQLPLGSATVALAGFPTKGSAPGDDDRDSTTCITDPPNVGKACAGIGGNASYRSAPKAVSVEPGPGVTEAGQIDVFPVSTPTPTLTPVLTPTPTLTPLPTPSPTTPPSTCPSPRGAPTGPALWIPDQMGTPGSSAIIMVRLATGSAQVAGTQSDIAFDARAPIVTLENGQPSCTVNPNIDKGDTSFAFEPFGCSGNACTSVRALVVSAHNVVAIADGATLFTCNVDINATASGTLNYTFSGVVFSDPNGDKVPGAAGQDGLICLGGAGSPTSSPTPTQTPTNTVPVPTTPPASNTPTPTLTPVPTPSATSSPSTCPNPHVAPPGPGLWIPDQAGTAGSSAILTVKLAAGSAQVAGTQSDITFDASAPIAAKANGKPNCTVNADISKGATSFAYRPNGCSGAACTAVRALVLATDNTDPIPDGSTLFTCNVNIGAEASGTLSYTFSGVILSDPNGGKVTDAGDQEGSICLGGEGSPTPSQVPTATPTLTPEAAATSTPVPTVQPGLQVHGTVLMPNGQVAARPGSLLQRVAAAVLPEAAALTGNVSPVGANVDVRLSRLDSHGNGADQPVLAQASTNDQGEYVVSLPAQSGPDTCRFLLSVGDGATLTRAFVTTTDNPQDIEFISETAVALLLAQVQQGDDLCRYTSGELDAVVADLRNLSGNVAGTNVADINRNALSIARSQTPPILPPIPETPTPSPTSTPTSTPFASFTPSQVPTATATATEIATATPSETPTATATFTSTPRVLAFVANESDNTVSVIDTQSGVVDMTVPVGSFPVGVAAAPHGAFVYVANAGGNSVSVIDTADEQVVSTVQVGANPIAVAFSPGGGLAYVTNAGDNTVSIIDTAKAVSNPTIAELTRVAAGNVSRGLGVTVDGTLLYLPNTGTSASPGATISILDTQLMFTDPAHAIVQTLEDGLVPTQIALQPPDGGLAYVTDQGTPNVPGSTVSVIDTALRSIVGSINVGSNPVGVAVSAPGLHTAFVSNYSSNTVSVIDTAAVEGGNFGAAVTATIPLDSSGVVITSTLAQAIAATDTTITLVAGSRFRVNGTIQIDDELITYGSSLSGVTRGAHGTAAAAHLAGSLVSEVNAPSATPVASSLQSAFASSDNALLLADAALFPTSGTVQIGNELITYLGKSGNSLTPLFVATGIPAAHGAGTLVSMVVSPGALTVALTPDASTVYVVNELTNTVSVIDTALALSQPLVAAVGSIAVGRHPQGIAIASVPAHP